jgi:putative ABC exporter
VLIASLYIIVCSAKNRIRSRLRRLREPRYLVGAIAAVVYFYLTIFVRMRSPGGGRSRRSRQPQPEISLAAFRAAGPSLVGLGLFVMMVLGWLFPGKSGLLEFTESEVQFLFPAPVTRRSLIIHRLLRSQLGLLFAAIVPALVFPSGSPASRAKFAVSMWIILVTMRVHFTGITLARASLLLRGAGGTDARRRQWIVPAVMAGAVAVVATTIVRAFVLRPATDVGDFLNRFGEVVTSGAPRVILWPFVALTRPLFTAWPGPFLSALALAIGVLALNVVWVLRSDDALQEITAQIEAKRDTPKVRGRAAPRAGAAGWTLSLHGRPELLFMWKSAMEMLRGVNAVSLLRYGGAAVGISVSLTSALLSATHSRGSAAAFGLLAVAIAGFAALLGPQIARNDLREDLLHLELLKTWPVRASALIRGEMLGPAAMLTGCAWLALLCALPLSAAAFTTRSLPMRVSVALALAILAPAIIAAQLTVHNAAAIVFPGWVPLGTQRPRGLDAMGQRLILFGGVIIALTIMLAPPAVAAIVVWFAFRGLLGPAVLVPAALVCTVLVGVEVLLATEALGPMYERIDLSAVERAD